MSNVINLRTIRKQAARDAKRRVADESAARHGRTRTERDKQKTAADKARAHLDAHKRES